MFTYGTQVNPSLLRQDFSPLLQAAQAQAQATQQAAAIRAQTMANIGSTIGNAIQTYTQKQEQKKQKEAAVKTIGAIFENNPELAAGLKVPVDASGKPDRGAIEAVIKTFDSPADALKIASTLEELGVTRKARQQQEQAASYAAMLRQGGGQVPSPVSNQTLAQFSPQARMAGEMAYLQNEQARATAAKTRAEEAALRAPKPTSIEALRYQSQQEKDAAESRINTRANQIALGEKGSPLPNKAEENAAMVAASKIYEAGLRPNVVEVPNPQTGRTEFFTETRDITGKLVGRKPVYAPNLTPEEQATAAEQVATAQSAVKWVDQFSENASSAGVRLSKNKAALSLLESGKVQTGPGAPIIQNFRRVFAAYGGDPKTIQETADFGLLTNLLGDQLIDYFSKTKGAISDYETKYFSTLAAKENKTNAENVAILKIAVALDERTQAANKALRQAIKNGEVKTARDQRMFIEDYVDSNPIDFNLIPAQAVDPIIERNLRKGGK